MELSQAIRTGYYQVLNGNVLHNGNPVKIYDVFALPENTSYPYILLSTQTGSQRNLKTGKVYEATLLVDIVTGSLSPIGRKQSEQIAEQIENIINPDSNVDIDITAYGYSIGETVREEDTDLADKRSQYYILRKLMRYRHLVSKL